MLRIFTGVQGTFGDQGCPFGTRTSVVCGINTSVAIPAGVWVVETDGHTTARYTYNKGSNFITQIAASSVGIVYSDGFNCEFRGDGTGGTAQRSQLLALA